MSKFVWYSFMIVVFLGCGGTTTNEPTSKKQPKIDEGRLLLNEVLPSNAHTIIDPDFSKFADYIELYNSSKEAIDISDYILSDKPEDEKWTIPKGTIIPAGGYMIFWADGEDVVKKGYHTNFSLKAKGEDIVLLDSDNKLVDSFSFEKLKADVSVVKAEGKVIYMEPTPLEANSPSLTVQNLSQKPTFTHTTPFFDKEGVVTLNAPVGATIYYTLDGSYPTLSSKVYEKPFTLTKNTVIRARTKENGKLLSYAATQSYFIDDWSELAIVSISMDETHLMDDTVGIYAIGTNGLKNDGCEEGPDVANFYQHWKRPANIEYYDKEKKLLQFSQEFDVKISGSCSRVIAQKSFSFEADKKYEKEILEYKLFPHKDIDKIKGFKLRNAGQDWYSTMFRDAFLQSVVRGDDNNTGMDIDYQDYQPAAVFINGKYWGIYNIREKKNEDYLAENHKEINPKKVDILQDYMLPKEGSNEHYNEMIEFIKTHDLSVSENYNKVAEMMDIENYMDYTIAETYFANDDWIYTNVRYWREAENSPKWRWILEDLDLAMGQYGDDINQSYLGLLSSPIETHNNPPWSTFLFRSLLTNDNFKRDFKARYKGYLDGIFETSRVQSIMSNFRDAIKSEVPRHIDRWEGYAPSTLGGSVGSWEDKINHLKNVIDTRNQTVRGELDAL